MKDNLRIAMIGTRGVPARYGGFETCVEEVGSRLAAAGHEVVVYCRPGDDDAEQLPTYKGMQLVHLPIVRKRSLETLAHTGLSVLHRSLRAADAAIVFNAANAPLLPVIRARGIPVATHVDGLEWQRGKWGPAGQRYYRMAESLAVRWSDALIADARGIADYYAREFGAASELIAYGAPITKPENALRIADLDLAPGKYHLIVARFEPENHVLEAVQGYVASRAELPLVVVGSAPYADDYTAAVQAAADHRVRLLGGVWDQEQLDQLYAHALTYVHGHSVGGTNPSLLRAAGAGAHTLAFDVSFNREVIGLHGEFWRSPGQLAGLLTDVEADPDRAHRGGEALQREITRYNWDDVAAAYERLSRRLAAGAMSPVRPSGRRSGAPERQPAREYVLQS
jgi:glycosyltransferase involved in cell wall biosynthesis